MPQGQIEPKSPTTAQPEISSSSPPTNPDPGTVDDDDTTTFYHLPGDASPPSGPTARPRRGFHPSEKQLQNIVNESVAAAMADDSETNIHSGSDRGIFDDSPTLAKALAGPNREKWLEAMKAEFHSLIARGTWRLVPRPTTHRVIGNRWVLKLKRDSSGQPCRFKARLVAQGYGLTKGRDYDDSFSSTPRFTAVRLLIAAFVQHSLELFHFDWDTAFLYGVFEGDFYMEQPEGFFDDNHPTFVCKLIKGFTDILSRAVSGKDYAENL